MSDDTAQAATVTAIVDGGCGLARTADQCGPPGMCKDARLNRLLNSRPMAYQKRSRLYLQLDDGSVTSQQLEYVLVALGLAAGFALVLIFRSRAARWLLITWLLFLTASLLGLFYFDFQCDGDPFMTGYYNCAGGAEQAKSGNSIGALSLFFMIALIITMPLIAGAAITLEVRKRLNRDDLITNVPLVIGVLILFLLILAPWI